MSERNYKVTIVNTMVEMSARERIQVKKTDDCIKINDVVNETESLDIEISNIVDLDIHNEMSKDEKDYSQFVIFSKDGSRYVSGSVTLRDSISDIVAEITATGEDIPLNIRVTAVPSKNRQGQHFLTCNLL